MTDWIQVTGFAAATLTTAAFVPQVVKTWRSRSAEDLSLGMFLMFCAGVFLWLIYGIAHSDIPMIVANLVTFLLAMILLYFKFRFK